MKLKNQVCSLELAKKLKELGVKQESLFYWADEDIVSSYDFDILLNNNKVRSLVGVNNSYPDEDIDDLYSAFTVAELGEMLPEIFSHNSKNYYITMDCDKHIYYENMSCKNQIYSNDSHDNDNEVDSRAKMLIYLIENNLVKVEDIA